MASTGSFDVVTLLVSSGITTCAVVFTADVVVVVVIATPGDWPSFVLVEGEELSWPPPPPEGVVVAEELLAAAVVVLVVVVLLIEEASELVALELLVVVSLDFSPLPPRSPAVGNSASCFWMPEGTGASGMKCMLYSMSFCCLCDGDEQLK